MSRYQFWLLPLLLGPMFLLMGAWSREPAPKPQVADVTELTPPREDPAALQLLEQAAAIFGPDQVRWLEMKIWRQQRLGPSWCTLEGRYLSAPGQRMRLDVNLKVGQTSGAMRIVCDGKVLWQSQQVGDQKAAISASPLPPQPEAGDDAAALAQARLQFLQEHGDLAPAPLLRTLRERLQTPTWQKVRSSEREMIRLAGAWPTDAAAVANTHSDFRLPYQPRRCCVYFDAETLWPHRVEWWGAATANDSHLLLAQWEFRDPVFNPLSAEQCAREFTLPQ